MDRRTFRQANLNLSNLFFFLRNCQRFEHVKQAYVAHQHKKGLKNRVEGETSGDYKKMMSSLVGN